MSPNFISTTSENITYNTPEPIDSSNFSSYRRIRMNLGKTRNETCDVALPNTVPEHEDSAIIYGGEELELNKNPKIASVKLLKKHVSKASSISGKPRTNRSSRSHSRKSSFVETT